MVIYLLEAENYRFAFEDPSTAAELAVKFVEQDVKRKKGSRQVISDFGGLHIMSVESFDPQATAAYIETMKINRKVSLQVNIPCDGILKQASIYKILLEGGTNAILNIARYPSRVNVIE